MVIAAYERYNRQGTLQRALEFKEAYTRNDEYDSILSACGARPSDGIAPAEEQAGGAGGAGEVGGRPSTRALLQAAAPADDGVELDFRLPIPGGDRKVRVCAVRLV